MYIYSMPFFWKFKIIKIILFRLEISIIIPDFCIDTFIINLLISFFVKSNTVNAHHYVNHFAVSSISCLDKTYGTQQDAILVCKDE